MFKKSKKIIAVFLSILTLFSVLSLGASAAAEKADEEYVTIYLRGYGGDIYENWDQTNSRRLYPTGVDVGAKVKEVLLPCLAELALGTISKDYDAYCDELYNAIAPIYDELRLNPDGTVKDNSGRPGSALLYKSYSLFETGEIMFYYDWRLSPMTLAEQLHEFINAAMSKYNLEKVNLLGRCLGANVVAAYLELYGDEAVEIVDKIIYYVPSIDGIGLIGKIFSGEIEINAKYLDIYVDEMFKYLDIMEDGLVKDFIGIMLSVFEQASLFDVGAEKLQELIDAIKDNLIPRLVRDTYGSFPSFWSMVPDADLEKAVEFVYNTDEIRETYKGTLDLIEQWNTTVQKDSRQILIDKSEAFDFYVISKYNLPAAPIMGKGCANTDAVAEVPLTSFGATSTEFGKKLSTSYIEAMSEDDKVFLSPDLKIDASTCALPEKTWFIKNCFHDHFPASVDALINRMLQTKGMTVFTEEEYPQYLDAEVDAETLSIVDGVDKDVVKADSKEGKIRLLINFIIFAVKLLTSVLKSIKL